MSEYSKRFLFFLLIFISVSSFAQVITGAQQVNEYLSLLKKQRVGLVVNQTSLINSMHLVDSLKKCKVNITRIFAPEHGFRGDHEAGAHIKSGKDPKTGLQVVSLYGDHKKPTPADLKNVDIVIFDIQDVGARFYTYISTLHYVMEACAENKKQLIVLDRPNPNGFYIDGPILDPKFKSFVGMHPVPIVHGMTIGEYANMINGEHWLKDSLQCRLKVVLMKNYDHNTRYALPVKPSPNLPTMEAIYLYPSLCLFEGTSYSVGRGTNKPFECIGKPGLTHGDFTFTPKPIKGVADNPPYADKECRGYLLTNYALTVFKEEPKLNIGWLIDMYQKDTAQSKFFTPFFDKLAGTDELRKQIEQGMNEEAIRQSWHKGLEDFRNTRRKYLLYKEFTYFTKRGKS